MPPVEASCTAPGNGRECDECTIALKHISKDFRTYKAHKLRCPRGLYPVVIDCKTKCKPSNIVKALKRTLRLKESQILAACRKIPVEGQKEPTWEEVDLPSALAEMAPRMIGLMSAPEDLYIEHRNKHGSPREVTILVDFERQIMGDGEDMQAIEDTCNKWGEFVGTQSRQLSNNDACLHRLKWFRKVFPKRVYSEGPKITYRQGATVRHKNRKGSIWAGFLPA